MLTTQQALNVAFEKKTANLVADPANMAGFQLLAAGNQYLSAWLENKGFYSSATLYFHFQQPVADGDVHLGTMSGDAQAGVLPSPNGIIEKPSMIRDFGFGSYVNTVFWLNNFNIALMMNAAAFIRFSVRNLFDQDIYFALAWTHTGG